MFDLAFLAKMEELVSVMFAREARLFLNTKCAESDEQMKVERMIRKPRNPG